MLNQTRHEVLVLGTIKFSKQHYAPLSFLEKLAFYAKWLDPDSSVFTSEEFNTMIANQPGLQLMLDAWDQLTNDVNSNHLNHHASKIQDFRIYIQNGLFKSLENSVDKKNKLSQALLALSVVSRSGFYLAGISVTTPDPQLVGNVQKIIQAQRMDRLKAFKNKFVALPLKFKKAALKLLTYPVSHNTRLARWVNKAANHLSSIENKTFQAKFVENLFESYQSDVIRAHIGGLQKSLFNRWGGANKDQTSLRKTVAKKLFIDPIEESPKKFSSARNMNR